MCAKKVRKHLVVLKGPIGTGPRPEVMQWGDSDERRRTIERLSETGELDEETAIRVARKKMTWRDWFLYDLLRYLYALGALSVVAFAISNISWTYHVRDPVGIAALGLGGFAAIVVEFFVYKAIWPHGVFTEGWPAGKGLRKALRRLRWRL